MLINPEASVVLACVSLKTLLPFALTANKLIRRLTALFATISPELFLKIDWKLIFCGACAMANNGKKSIIMILAFMLFIFNSSRLI